MSELFRIKPLEWEADDVGENVVALGFHYSVFRAFNPDGSAVCYWSTGDGRVRSCASPEEGKQLAEAHWNAYIQQALIPVETNE